MRTLVILSHPHEKSYCYALYEAIVESLEASGGHVDTLHLDRESFDAVMREADLAVYAGGQSADPAVLGYQSRIRAASQLVFIFPIWWEGMPGLLKGFIDKVFTKGFAYEASKHRVTPKLTHIRRAVVVTTMNTPAWIYRWLYGNAVQRAFVRGTLRKCGVRKVAWIPLTPVSHAPDAKRRAWLARVAGLFSTPL